MFPITRALMKFWWQEQSWVFTAQSLQNVKKCANSGCCTVGRLGSANQPFCAHKAECQTHTKDLLGWGCILGRAGTDGKRERCSIVHIAIDLPHFLTSFLAALAALCIYTNLGDWLLWPILDSESSGSRGGDWHGRRDKSFWWRW